MYTNECIHIHIFIQMLFKKNLRQYFIPTFEKTSYQNKPAKSQSKRETVTVAAIQT